MSAFKFEPKSNQPMSFCPDHLHELIWWRYNLGLNHVWSMKLRWCYIVV